MEVFKGFMIPPAPITQFMRLDFDGHLKVYERRASWEAVSDLLSPFPGECGYPMVCGKYGVCSNGQCGCPQEAFKQIDYRHPNLGCSLITPISCNYSQYHSLLELKDTSYFTLNSLPPDNSDLDEKTGLEDCKKTCLENCSCKAAVFSYGWV
ncbi:hypothetical protein Acr_00g0096230 [Actinidia rufa]|uniref:Apple domain-containing protein n=1 Tax=Actinidia rufa TaxID=165716 RepID=A0A7J0DYS7_9ERIC|nr:hypothetical protein Acr_00g0096230 [Actinidia rufa]